MLLFVSSFEGKKKRKGNREFNERQRLQHKLKREHKGALREIRKDSRFLAKQHLQETIEKSVDLYFLVRLVDIFLKEVSWYTLLKAANRCALLKEVTVVINF